MSTTQGEQKQSIRSTIIGGTLAIIAIAGVVGGVVVASDNARAQAEQLHLLSVAKSSSIVMEAASTEDAAVTAGATQAEAFNHTDQLAAQAQAAYDAKIAAEKAAAAKAAADAAAAQAAQQAAQQQSVQQTQTVQAAPSAPSAPAAPIRCPAGSQANSNDGVNDTSCFPTICFTIKVPDPNHPECDVAFKP
jgi:membrane protein involved in colicin uptake